jgi:hypothetical protein
MHSVIARKCCVSSRKWRGHTSVINLRIIGTPDEIHHALESLDKAFEVLEMSQPYKCHSPNEDKVRVYLVVQVPEPKRGRSKEQGRG